eukprot:SAG22_NODE_2299_length_2739_cov_3.085985_1_plen_182_part_00
MNSADMIFVQVKSRSAATISFRQFMQALELIAVMATEDEEDENAADAAFEAILKKVIDAAATTLVDKTVAQLGTTGYKKSAIFAKLNDAGQYTGAHRHRFDRQTGQGRGRAGRTEHTDYTRAMHQITRTYLGGRNDIIRESATDRKDVFQQFSKEAEAPLFFAPGPRYHLLKPRGPSTGWR